MQETIFNLFEAVGMIAGATVVILLCLALVAGFSVLLNKDWKTPR